MMLRGVAYRDAILNPKAPLGEDVSCHMVLSSTAKFTITALITCQCAKYHLIVTVFNAALHQKFHNRDIFTALQDF